VQRYDIFINKKMNKSEYRIRPVGDVKKLLSEGGVSRKNPLLRFNPKFRGTIDFNGHTKRHISAAVRVRNGSRCTFIFAELKIPAASCRDLRP
jgi:hypothetical protein